MSSFKWARFFPALDVLLPFAGFASDFAGDLPVVGFEVVFAMVLEAPFAVQSAEVGRLKFG